MRSLVLALLLCLTACSSFNPVKMAKSVLSPDSKGLSVDTELTVGDKQENTNVDIGDKSNQQAESIVNNTIEDIPLWVILLMIIGWMAPDPATCWNGTINLIGRTFGALTRLLPWVK